MILDPCAKMISVKGNCFIALVAEVSQQNSKLA